jgi:tricarballylate dehydrogenase
MDVCDVIVVGGGNAGLCAALAAADRGARVLLLERAPRDERGGNSFLTAGAFRVAYSGVEDVAQLVDDSLLGSSERLQIGRYPEEEFYRDLLRVTESGTDPALARIVTSQSLPTMTWLRRHGVEFVLAYDRQSYLVDGTHRFWGGLVVKTRGEGAGLVTALYDACQKAGVAVHYDARATALAWDRAAHLWGVVTATGGVSRLHRAPAVVLASGGFEADAEMRAAHLGPLWREVKVRGTPHNTGDGIMMGLMAGAQRAGDWSGCHAVAWDANAPAYNTRRLSQHYERDSYPLGVYVNLGGERFVDEGEDFRNYTYARFGQEIIRQPRHLAFQIFDQKTVPLLKVPYTFPDATRVEAPTWGELAGKAGIESEALERTIAAFNASVNTRPFNPAVKDGKAALGLRPPKSNWAQPLDVPPYVCFPVTCGITFTFGGLGIAPDARVLDVRHTPLRGLFACGELVGGLFRHNYLGGSGLAAGAVLGRLAGDGAAAVSQGISR